MGAANRARPIEQPQKESPNSKLASPRQVSIVASVPRVPALRVTPLLTAGQPRRFARVPTRAVGVKPD